MAFGKSNDAVKLAFIDSSDPEEKMDGLDLTMLSEVKRSTNGVVELKLLNRLEVLKLLLEELRPTDSGAVDFLKALNAPSKEAE